MVLPLPETMGSIYASFLLPPLEAARDCNRLGGAQHSVAEVICS